MNGTRTIRAIRFNNILSFGAFEGEFKLEPLNVLIGPNTSGKSNLIEVLSLLAAMPRDLLVPIREGGGITEWLWKGADTSTATIDVTLDFPPGPVPIRHRLALTSTKGRLEVVDEAIEGAWPTGDYPQPYIYYAYQAGRPVLNVLPEGSQRDDWSSRRLKQLRREDVSPEQSILSQRRDVDLYPELTFLSSQYSRFKFYRQWNLGRYTEPRLPQKVDLPEDHLLENASNLGIVINNLLNIPSVRNSIRDRLRAFSDDFEDLTTRIHGGTVQIYLHERGLRQSIPATRLSMERCAICACWPSSLIRSHPAWSV